MKIQFKAYRNDFVRNAYIKSSDRRKLTDEEIKEVLDYENISKFFEVRNWCGSYTEIKATLTKVELNECSDFIFTIEINKNINPDYAPSPSDILEHKGLLFPVSYQQL